MAPKPRFRKLPTIPENLFVDIKPPDLYYAVQEAFQEEGVIFVDLRTGNRIKGQVNFPNLGMIDPTKHLNHSKSFGFVRNENIPTPPAKERQDIDATFNLKPESDDPNSPLFIVVQVIDHREIHFWAEKCIKVAKLFFTRRAGPAVVFGISSLCNPDELDPQATIRTVLGYAQGYDLENGPSHKKD